MCVGDPEVDGDAVPLEVPDALEEDDGEALPVAEELPECVGKPEVGGDDVTIA